MAINTKTALCNLALSLLGNLGTITDFEIVVKGVVNTKELTCDLWYDVTRELMLEMTMPNFSKARRSVARVVGTPPFPFGQEYEYPTDCLKVLGIGAIEDKANTYSIESSSKGSSLSIYTDIFYEDGLPLRFIKNITDVTAMTPAYKISFAWFLAGHIALTLTQDVNKAKLIQQIMSEKLALVSSLSSQENLPIRINNSRFLGARRTGFPKVVNKR